jgi:hypothetical protein
VGFKLLSGSPVEQLLAEAERSLESNRVDLVVANDWTTVRAGRHEIHLVRTDRPPLRIGPPDDPAASLIEHAITWAREARSAAG